MADSPPVASWDERRFTRLEDDLRQLNVNVSTGATANQVALSQITAQIAQLQLTLPDHFIPRREFELVTVARDARIKSIEDSQTWAFRLVLGTLLTTLINVALLAIRFIAGGPN